VPVSVPRLIGVINITEDSFSDGDPKRDRLPGGGKAQIRPAEGASRLLHARTGGKVSEVDDGEVVRFEY